MPPAKSTRTGKAQLHIPPRMNPQEMALIADHASPSQVFVLFCVLLSLLFLYSSGPEGGVPAPGAPNFHESGRREA